MSMKLVAAVGAIVLLIGGMTRAAVTVISIPTDGNVLNTWGPNGPGIENDQTYGQVFTAPLGDFFLDSYTFTVWTTDIPGHPGIPFPFVSQVYSWDGLKATGAPLYSSEVEMTTTNPTAYVFHPAIGVTAGQKYVACVTNEPGGVSIGRPEFDGNGRMLATYSYNNPDGMFVFAEGNQTAPVSGRWATAPSANAAFDAVFSVPEPPSLIHGAWLSVLFVFFARKTNRIT